MNENFVTFEVSKKLKKKGFNDGCYKYYEGEELKWSNSPWLETRYNDYLPHITAAPTIYQVLKWLREEKEIMVFPVYSTNTSKWYCVAINADSLEQYKLSLSDSYEEAALAGIEYVIDNLI